MPFCYTTSLSAVPVAQRVKEQAKEIRKAIRHFQQGMPYARLTNTKNGVLEYE